MDLRRGPSCRGWYRRISWTQWLGRARHWIRAPGRWRRRGKAEAVVADSNGTDGGEGHPDWVGRCGSNCAREDYGWGGCNNRCMGGLSIAGAHKELEQFQRYVHEDIWRLEVQISRIFLLTSWTKRSMRQSLGQAHRSWDRMRISLSGAT